jgi:hypothetical protein
VRSGGHDLIFTLGMASRVLEGFACKYVQYHTADKEGTTLLYITQLPASGGVSLIRASLLEWKHDTHS